MKIAAKKLNIMAPMSPPIWTAEYSPEITYTKRPATALTKKIISSFLSSISSRLRLKT